MKIGFGKFGLVFALLIAILHLRLRLDVEWVPAPANYWVGNAAAQMADKIPPTAKYWIEPSKSAADGVGNASCGDISVFDMTAAPGGANGYCGININELCGDQSIDIFGYTEMTSGGGGRDGARWCIGWQWAREFCTNLKTGKPVNPVCVYPCPESGIPAADIWSVSSLNLQDTCGLVGAPRPCENLSEADGSNLEDPIGAGNIVGNDIGANSSIDLKGGNVYHSSRLTL